MNILKKINLRQPKYIIPALIYLPLLFTGYMVIDMLHTAPAEIVDQSLETTDYLNPKLPDAKVRTDLEGKYESMLKSYGKIDDFTAISIIDRDEEDTHEQYESHYGEEDLLAMETDDTLSELERQIMESAMRGEAFLPHDDMPYVMPDIEREKDERIAMLERELEEALTAIRTQQEAVARQATAADTEPERERHAVTAPSEEDGSYEVARRARQTSSFFHTLEQTDPEAHLIGAIIDEESRATDGSRVRLRLLDDVEIGDALMRRGSYIYAIMASPSGQRMRGTVRSILHEGRILKVNLTIYDTDGLEGLSVPSSQVRETGKEVASSAMTGNMNMSQGSATGSLSQWGMQAAQNAYQRTTGAIGKAIRRNTVHLKYGTFVYLVNGSEQGNR